MAAKKRRTEIGDLWTLGGPDEVHNRLGNSWWAWFLWVDTLETSARCIGYSFRYEENKGEIIMPAAFMVRAMLLGYAIEGAAKAVWVRNGNALIKNGKYTGVPGARDHDLLPLCKAVGFTPSAKQADLLNRLSKFVSFAGRYPAAKTPAAMQPNRADGIGPIDVGFFSKRDFRVTYGILNKLNSMMSGKKTYRAFRF